jgi:hypothetical protein
MEMGSANLALIQLQGIVVGGLAAFIAAIMAALSSAAPFQVNQVLIQFHNIVGRGGGDGVGSGECHLSQPATTPLFYLLFYIQHQGVVTD